MAANHHEIASHKLPPGLKDQVIGVAVTAAKDKEEKDPDEDDETTDRKNANGPARWAGLMFCLIG